ncbi:MAG: hypothetical protein ACRDPX_01910 [Gaiellaceae bacterium]
MAIARVVSFEGVDRARIEQIKGEIESGDRPNDVPATEFLLLHDGDTNESLAIVFFDSEDDYATGDAALNAMPRDDTPGTRTSVRKYDVVGRMTA